jgi:murein DD-endopeptidase MepM/ murein hydrolase activator NlpD
MFKVAVIGVVLLVLLGPVSCLAGIAALVSPSSQAFCLPTTGLVVTDIPDQLEATTTDGVQVSLSRTQLGRAAAVITVGGQTPDVGSDGVTIALMTALTESRLQNLSNVTAYPASGDYENDGDGNDHDSLGVFQQRPSTGWGAVADLIDPTFQARAFYGGPTGPNTGEPPGLLDVPAWRELPKGAAAQAVQRSAFPDRYSAFEPVAVAIIAALTHTGGRLGDGRPHESSQVVFPLPEGTWVGTSGYGWRTDPITGLAKLHTGVDYAAPAMARVPSRLVAA